MVLEPFGFNIAYCNLGLYVGCLSIIWNHCLSDFDSSRNLGRWFGDILRWIYVLGLSLIIEVFVYSPGLIQVSQSQKENYIFGQ